MPRLCIVFDLDDTLYLERDYVLSGFRAVGEWIRVTKGAPHFAHCAWQLFESGAGDQTFQRALNAIGQKASPPLIEAMLHVYRSHSPDISLLPDSVHCLAEMKGFAEMGLITDGRARSQLLKCARLGLPALFRNIVCTGTWGEQFYKPHHRAFEFMEDRLGGERALFVYVADNPHKDFAAPLARGWKTIRIRRTAGLNALVEAPPGLEPHTELPDLWALPQVVTALNQAISRSE